MQSIINGRQEVTVTDIDMPFWSMVKFMVKWTVATIPAMVLLFFIGIGFFFIASIFLAAVGGTIQGLTR